MFQSGSSSFGVPVTENMSVELQIFLAPSAAEAQALRASLELGQVRQEIDRRIAEKEEEFENSR